jgi:hypothetical protein
VANPEFNAQKGRTEGEVRDNRFYDYGNSIMRVIKEKRQAKVKL